MRIRLLHCRQPFPQDALGYSSFKIHEEARGFTLIAAADIIKSVCQIKSLPPPVSVGHDE
jgi:hypothetical protein